MLVNSLSRGLNRNIYIYSVTWCYWKFSFVVASIIVRHSQLFLYATLMPPKPTRRRGKIVNSDNDSDPPSAVTTRSLQLGVGTSTAPGTDISSDAGQLRPDDSISQVVPRARGKKRRLDKGKSKSSWDTDDETSSELDELEKQLRKFHSKTKISFSNNDIYIS
jgi:hypothetical protein